MRVITLDREELLKHCHRLQAAVETSFAPDLIVGIENGGRVVAENMFETLPHISVKAQRNSTPMKNKLGAGKKLLSKAPLWVKDTLRMAEASLLNRTSKGKGAPSLSLNPENFTGGDHILIVDDAVDSGRTLKAVANALKELYPRAELRTAAITVTTANPLASPDYFIYNDKTLIRFPWSMDYAGER